MNPIISFFLQKFQRNFEINKNWIRILEHQELLNPLEVALFSKVINSQHIWNAKFKNQDADSEIDDILPLDYLLKLNFANCTDSVNFIENYFMGNPEVDVIENDIIQFLFECLQEQSFYRGRFYQNSKISYLFDSDMIIIQS